MFIHCVRGGVTFSARCAMDAYASCLMAGVVEGIHKQVHTMYKSA